MKIRVRVGDTEIRTDGLDLSKQQIVNLLREAAALAIQLRSSPGDDSEARQLIGFTAHLELDPSRDEEPDLSEWFEESP